MTEMRKFAIDARQTKEDADFKIVDTVVKKII